LPKLQSTAKELKRKLNYFELLEYTTTLYVKYIILPNFTNRILLVDNFNYKQLKKLRILLNPFEEIELLYLGQNPFFFVRHLFSKYKTLANFDLSSFQKCKYKYNT